MNKTAGVFGAIWGVFAMFFSLLLFLTIFAPGEIQGLGLGMFGSSVLSYYDGMSFATSAWAVAVGAFGLGALGLIGAGIARQHHISAGIFMLISSIGMLVVCFQPFLMGENGVFGHFVAFLESGEPAKVLIVLLTLLMTLLGFLGSLFSLVAKPKLSRPQPINQPQPTAVPPVEAQPTAEPTVEAAASVPAVEAQPEAIPTDRQQQPGDGPVQ